MYFIVYPKYVSLIKHIRTGKNYCSKYSYHINIADSAWPFEIVDRNKINDCYFNFLGQSYNFCMSLRIVLHHRYNTILLSESYDLYEIKTIKKFNLQITPRYIYHVSLCGHTHILKYLKKNNKISHCPEKTLDFSSKYGRVNVLEWWKNSGFSLNYTSYAIYYAIMHSNIDVLEWWKNSGLELKGVKAGYMPCFEISPVVKTWLDKNNKNDIYFDTNVD